MPPPNSAVGNKLSEEAKTTVVCAVACFDSPSMVVALIKKEFGVSITPQAVEAYDPTKRAGRNLSEKWRSLFEVSRRTFVEDTSAIPISHRATRLRSLGRMAAIAEERGNYALAAQLHEQAAKECGDVYTNRQRITGSLNVSTHEQALADLDDDDDTSGEG